MAVPEVMPCCLVMGIAPAVNDLTVEQVRETVMGRTHDSAAVHSLMTRFGHLSTESGVGRWFAPRGASGAAAVLA